MAGYAVNLDAIGDIRLDAPQGGVFGALFPARDKEISGNGDLVTTKGMKQYMDYMLLGVKYLSQLEQNILNEHLSHMQENSTHIIKLQKALIKLQTHVGLNTEAQETEFDLVSTEEHLKEMQAHHEFLLQKTAELKTLKNFAKVEERLKKGIRNSIQDISKEIKDAQPSTLEMVKALYGLAVKYNKEWEDESNASDTRRKKRKTKK